MEGKVVFEGVAKDGTPLVIRYPTLNDTQAMLDYINTLSKEQTFIRFQGEQLTYEFEEKFVKDLVQKIDEHNAVYLLVFSDNKLIGAAGVTLAEKISKHNAIFGLTIAEEYRERGIGTLLMEKALDEAINNLEGLKNIILTVFANNPVAVSLYEKLGFKVYGRLPEGISYKGEYVDEILMYKKVR